MRTTQTVFKVARAVFGTSHLVFQSLADLSLEAEVSVLNKTGFELTDGTMAHFGDTWTDTETGEEGVFTQDMFREGRKAITKGRQQKVIAGYDKQKAKLMAIRARKEKSNLTQVA